jgi:hypothetical protein
MRMRRVRFVFVASLIALPSTALAQSAPPPPPGGAGTPQTSAERIAEARKRYELGLKLYEDGNYEAARIEFERALAIAPSYKILFNVGLAYKQLHKYVDALKAFEAYLQEGGTQVPPERRADVEKEIAELRPRIARVTITVNVAGAEVAIDDVAIGKAPLPAPVLVDPGVRKFSATAPGYLPVTNSLTVGSSESPTVTLALTELPKYEEKKTNPWVVPTIVGWSATGAAAVATTIFGVLALNAKSAQDKKLNEFGQTDSDLKNARDKTVTLSTVTDVLGITSIVFAGASTYLTLRMIGAKPNGGSTEAKASGTTLDLKVGPSALFAGGTF